MDVVVVSHTHWDREWYQPLGRMRQRLVALIDELLDERGAASPDTPFLLDGQSIVLEDYLRLRPERASALRAALSSGALEAGPWYVLADELIPSGEALVRNLHYGRQVLARVTGEAAGGRAAPAVLYCPDAFGHPAALPDLARGFGFGVVILWRGHGGAADPRCDTVRWRGRGGASVLLYHLSPSGYELGSNLPPDDDGAARRWRELAAVLVPRAVLDLALLPNGADHHALQVGRDAAVAALARAAAPHRVVQGGLRAFARLLEERAAGRVLPEVVGERRDSYGHTWTLQGTFSSRAAQKRRNAAVERLLVREAEPWLALADARRASRAGDAIHAALDEAWRTLLACHPHDTLCGCAVDAVAAEMDVRLASAHAQAIGVRDDAIGLLLGVDADRARGRRAHWTPALVVRNPAARPRGGVVDVELLDTIADEPVGPGSADGVHQAARLMRGAASVPRIVGTPPMQLLGKRRRRERIEPRRHYPDNDVVRSWRAVIWLDDPVPAYGLRPLALTSSTQQTPVVAAGDASGTTGLPSHVVPAGGTTADGTLRLGNGLVLVRVNPSGHVTLEADGYTIPDLLGIEWVGDRGDLYTHEPYGAPRTNWTYRGGRVRHAGPLRAELVLRYDLRVPRARRVGREVTIPLRLALRVDAGASLVHVRVRGLNRARDHRLRLRVRTGVREGAVLADAAFGPVERREVVALEEARTMEVPPPTAPLHRHVTLIGERAVTLVSDGLAEYEATTSGDLSVTLVRAVGALSRGTLAARPGHAGWPAATPAAQSPGSFVANFALLVHPRGATRETVVMAAERAAEDVLVPVVGMTWRWLLRVPPECSGIELRGEGLAFSAMLPQADGIHLRCVNLLGRPVAGAWLLPDDLEIAFAARARLDGTRLEPITLADGALRFTAAPYEIVTIAIALPPS